MAYMWYMVVSCVTALVMAVEVQATNESVAETLNTRPPVKWWRTNCPTNCSCYYAALPNSLHVVFSRKDLATVDCSNAGLTHSPKSLPNGTEVLIISNNFITKLAFLPPSTTLIHLDVSNNSIESLPRNPFAQYRQLHFLSLRRNKLTSLLNTVFYSVSNLASLDLSENQIQNLSAEVFMTLPHLKSLNLAQNSLVSVTAALFDNLHEVKELDMSYNQLITIEDTDFQGLVNLNLLNLSNNRIRNIGDTAFRALSNIIVLDLDHNQLQFVPRIPLQSLPEMKKLSLNGNPIHKLHDRDFDSLNIYSLSVSFMPNLEIVDSLAFTNLTSLTNIELHDNPRLIFIDPHAFSTTPLLKSLYFHNNQLTAISSRIIQYVPSVEQIHVYHNPLRCDCNAFWIREVIEEFRANNASRPYFNSSEFIKCDFPLNLTGVSIEDVGKEEFMRVCTPTSLPMFHENYTMDLGEELRLECHSYGVPEPTLTWLLPNGSEITTNNVKFGKFEIVHTCVLIIRQLTTTDSGLYGCKASNGVGFDISSTRITVTNKPVRLVLFNIGFDYISLSWNGTRHSSLISDYQLHYRKIRGDNEGTNTSFTDIKYRVILLGPQYRSYTVTNLNSNTEYEFCIVYVYDLELYKVDCEVFKTKSTVEFQNAIKKVVSEKIIAGVCTALGLIMAIVCMVTLVKKFRLHKDYETPYGCDDTDSVNIPLENVYQPLSTPMCSSKTSLLSVHKSHLDDY